MDTTTTIGLILIAVAAGLVVILTVWSLRRINRINDAGPRSAREILHADAGDADE